MIPILYEIDETKFTTNGIGRLSEAISCTVTEKKNSDYTLELMYPVHGKYFKELQPGRIIVATHDNSKKPQAFDIYRVTASTEDMITVHAKHVSYRLQYLIFYMSHLHNDAPASLMEKLNSATDSGIAGVHPFKFQSDVTVQDVMSDKNLNEANDVWCTLKEGMNMWDVLLDREAGMLSDENYGECGAFEFDMFNVKLHRKRGRDNGVKMRTGKNVKRLNIDYTNEEVVTAVVPWWSGRDPLSGEARYVGLTNIDDTNNDDSVTVVGATQLPYQRTVSLDLSSVYEQPPTRNELIKASKEFLRNHEYNTDKNYASYEVDLVYDSGYNKELQSADLCDIVTVEDVVFGLRVKLEITEVTYDVLRDRYTNMVVGSRQKTIPELIKKQNEIEFKRINTSLTQVADVSKKATVEHKVYPTNYDPSHPESWDDKYTGKLVDKDGKEVEQIGTINRKPIFVHTGGGGGEAGTIPMLRLNQYIATHDLYPEDLQFTIPYNIVTSDGTMRQAKGQPLKLVLNPFTFPIDNLKVGSRFLFTISGELVINDSVHENISIACNFHMRCDVKKIVDDTVSLEMLMNQCTGISSDASYVCMVGFVSRNLSEDRLRVIKNATCKILQS